MKLVAVLLLVTGCDRVFGLTGRTEDAAVSIIDAGPQIHVEGKYTFEYVYNDASHQPATKTLAMSDDHRPVATSFGQPVPVEWNPDDGTFSFDATTPYELRADGVEWQSSSERLDLLQISYGRPEAPPAIDVELQTTFNAQVMSGRLYALISTGIWSRQTIVPPLMGPFPIHFEGGTFFGNGPRLVDTAANDTLQLVTYTPGTPGEYLLSEVSSATVTMHEGQQNVTFNSIPATATLCNTISPSADLDIVRLRTQFPAFTAGSNGGWEIDATPLPDRHGVRLPILIRQRYVPDGDGVEQTVAYGNPFTGHPAALLQNGYVSRTLAGGFRLYQSITYHRLIPPAVGVCDLLEAGGPIVALAIEPELIGVPLETDDLVIAAPMREFVDLSWTIVGDATPDAYQVELWKITGGDGEVVRAFISTEPHVRIATSLFEAGSLYVFHIIPRSGIPGAAVGDYTRFTLPAWFGGTYSSSFRVVQ